MELSGLASAVYLEGPAADCVVQEAMCVGSKSKLDLSISPPSTKNGITSAIVRVQSEVVVNNSCTVSKVGQFSGTQRWRSNLSHVSSAGQQGSC